MNISGFEFTSLGSLRLLADTACPHTDVFLCSCQGTMRTVADFVAARNILRPAAIAH